jgi:hypothetical protein
MDIAGRLAVWVAGSILSNPALCLRLRLRMTVTGQCEGVGQPKLLECCLSV